MSEMPAMFPPGFDPKVYREANHDLRDFDDQRLWDHYERHGRSEGRVSSSIVGRDDFLALIPSDAKVLEIGPFDSPCVRGQHVDYLDLMTREELQVRAGELGRVPEQVPDIRWVAREGRLDGVTKMYDVVFSSHNVEHQTDLIDHFAQVSRILNDGGLFFLIVPDCRYCFDHFLPPSTIAGVLGANDEHRKRHSLKSVIEHRVLTTHNDPARHWSGDHGETSDTAEAIQRALDEHNSSPGGVDVHAWQFTPESFVRIVDQLWGLGRSELKVVAMYPTLRNNFEFKVILKKMR